MEIELRAPGYDADEAVFWLGDEVAPGGYGWAFPTGEGRVRLGIGVVRPDSDAEPRVLLANLLDVFRAHAGGTAAPVGALEMHSGLMPVIAPTATTLAADGLLVVGDAGGQGSTLLGEGIRYAVAAGRMAGEALASAGGDYTAAGLAAYPREWHRRTKRDLAISYAVNTRICRFRDEDWDRAVRRMQQLTPRQAARLFASDFSVRWGLGVLLTHPTLLRSVARALRQRA
jgi:digeranylgeranylglycerophospholipid reductase